MTNEAAGFDPAKKSVLICDTQPVAVEGLKWLIGSAGDLRFAGFVQELDDVYAVLNPEEAAAERAARKAAAEQAARERAEAEMAAALAASREIEALAAPSEMPGLGALASVVGFESPALRTAMVDSICAAMASGAGASGASGGVATQVAVETGAAVAVSEAVAEAFVVEVSEPAPIAIVGPIDAVVIDKALEFPVFSRCCRS
jgi:hypothetical protein